MESIIIAILPFAIVIVIFVISLLYLNIKNNKYYEKIIFDVMEDSNDYLEYTIEVQREMHNLIECNIKNMRQKKRLQRKKNLYDNIMKRRKGEYYE